MKESIVQQGLSMVDLIASRYKTTTLSVDDLRQEGFLGLLEAEKRYNSEKGVEFTTYASYWIKKYILSALKNEIEHMKNTDSLENVVVDEIEIGDDVTDFSTEQCVDNNQLKELNSLERNVYQLSIVEGRDLSQIAMRLNVSREKVRQIKQKLLRKLKTVVLQ
ncbi:MAG: sigma-70 family RNA polymerase sigma factor [Bacteroidales bacterium]